MNTTRTISARDILAALAAGLTSEELASKFEVSPRGLQRLIDRLLAERHKRGLGIMADVRSGMPVHAIAERNGFPEEKYGLIMNRLEELGISGPEDFRAHTVEREVQPTLGDRRSVPRLQVPVLTTKVFDATTPERAGQIIDLSALGLRIKGIRARVDEVVRLVMNVGDLAQIQVLTLECQCRWVSACEGTSASGSSGFEITSISEGSLRFLKTLLTTEFALANVS